MLERTDSVSESYENTGLQAGAQNVTVHFGLNKKHIILRLNIEHPVRQSILLPFAALHLFDAFVQTFASPVCTNWEQFGGSGFCSRTLKKNCKKGQNVWGWFPVCTPLIHSAATSRLHGTYFLIVC